MSALPRPQLSAGPGRELNDALHELHHRAGWPSLRTLARDAGVSHTTVSKVFSTAALPSWGTVELLVEAMGGSTADVHQLWLAASTPASSNGAPAPRIAGRQAELAAVRRHLEAGNGLLLVSGEAGIGKTTLVSAAAAATEGFVATGHCLPLSTEVPLLPVADCVRSVHEADPDWLRRAITTCPPYVGSSLASLVPEASSGDPAQTEDRQLLFAAVAVLLRTLATEQPLVLLIEDLHWADPATLDMLEHLLGRPLLVPLVGTWRTGDDATPAASTTWSTRIRRLAATTACELGPLDRDGTEEQLRLLGRTDRGRIDRIHARSLGQPLFTAQLAAHGEHESGLPTLLVDLLDRRLEGLDESAWALARTLGVAERPLALDVLATASDVSTDRIFPLLRTLQEHRLLRRVGDDAVELEHPLLADAVRRRLVVGEDVATHVALAEALGPQADAEAAEVAEHWRRAGVREREIDWRIAAARAAGARLDRRTEADHLLRVIEIWPDGSGTFGDPPATLADVYLEAMDSLRFSFRFVEAAALSESAEERLGEVDDEVRADLMFRRSIYRGDVEGAAVGLELLEQTLSLCGSLPVRETKVRALDRKQTLLFQLARAEEALAVVAEQVAAASELGDPVLLRDSLMRMAWHQGIAGHASEALQLLTSAVARSHADHDPLGDIRMGVYATDVLLICGAPADEVRAAGATALAVAHEYDLDNPQLMLVRVNIASALVRDGRVAEAERLIDTPPDTPLDVDRWPVHAVVATIESRHGRTREALERIEAVRAEISESARLDPEFLAESGDIAIWAGTPVLALGRLVDAVDNLAGSSPVRVAAPVLVMAARTAAHAGTAPLAQQLRALAARAGLLDDQHADDAHLAAHRATFGAELARLDGVESVVVWAEAAALWDRLTRPHDAAYCRWRAAEVALREGQGTAAARLLRGPLLTPASTYRSPGPSPPQGQVHDECAPATRSAIRTTAGPRWRPARPPPPRRLAQLARPRA